MTMRMGPEGRMQPTGPTRKKKPAIEKPAIKRVRTTGPKGPKQDYFLQRREDRPTPKAAPKKKPATPTVKSKQTFGIGTEGRRQPVGPKPVSVAEAKKAAARYRATHGISATKGKALAAERAKAETPKTAAVQKAIKASQARGAATERHAATRKISTAAAAKRKAAKAKAKPATSPRAGRSPATQIKTKTAKVKPTRSEFRAKTPTRYKAKSTTAAKRRKSPAKQAGRSLIRGIKSIGRRVRGRKGSSRHFGRI